MTEIPQSHRDLFEGQNFAHVATVMKDGSPQTTPVWVDIDGHDVLLNTAEGRLKARNLDREPRVALSIADASNPYRYIQVRGRVVDKTTEGADEHIDKMAKKYLGEERYPWRNENEVRVVYRIRPERVQAYG